jgi:predicted ATPase
MSSILTCCQARRFITFIDACYESKTKLFISSEVSIFQIFSDDAAGQKEISAHMRSVMDDLVRRALSGLLYTDGT